MFFMQPSQYPLEPYTEHMKPKRMHLFTAIQLGLFVLLFVVKSIKTIAIAFPLIIACCIPVRLYVLPKIFSEKELVVIDSDDDAVKEYLAAEKEMSNEESQEPEQDQEETNVAEEHDEVHTEEHDEEHTDQITPLPAIGAAEKRRARRDRKKTVSCPTGMLFAEVRLPTADTSIATIDEGNETDSEVTTEVPERPRRRRTKAISCPAHTLFSEAERHVASNYFFG